MSYHFPIILNQDEAERIVMVHLLQKVINTGHDYYGDNDDDATTNDVANQKQVIADNNNQNDDSVNRVVITTTSPSMPLFRIPKSVRLIMPDGNYLDSQTVDFEVFHEIARIRAEYKRDLDLLKRKQTDLKKKQPLSPAQAKKYDELEEAIQAKLKEKEKIDQKVVDITDGLQGKTVFKVEYNDKVIEQKADDSDYYEYYVKRGGVFDGDITFTLMLNYGYNGALEYSGEVRIVRPANVNDVTIINVDLGSDATQIGYYDGNPYGSKNVNIIEAMKESYASKREYKRLIIPSPEPLFTQEEKGNCQFYKTGNITFHKFENTSGKETCGYLEKAITESDTFINYLNVSAPGKNKNEGLAVQTWDHETVFSKKLINLKMLFTYPNQVGQYVSEVKYCIGNSNSIPKNVDNREDLALVMRAIYKQIITASMNQINDQRRKYFSVLLLVPNIYTQRAIELLLHEMNKLNDLDTDVRYDFRALSESDAAFVGLRKMQVQDGIKSALEDIIKKPSRRGDRVLVIDAGKGTTDYSIIHYEEGNGANNSSVPLRRNGIVGAGGSIDYVFARVFARQVFAHLTDLGIESTDVKIDKDEFISRFMNMIQKLPQVNQDRVMLMVELMKKEYKKKKGGKGYTTARVYTCFKKVTGNQGDSDDAKKIIKQLVKTDVDYGMIVGDMYKKGWEIVSNWIWDKETDVTSNEDDNEVEWVCRSIAKSVVNDIQENTKEEILKSIGYVIFTGRSFKFKPLRLAFEQKIMSLSQDLSGKRSVLKPSSWLKSPLEKVKIKNPNCDMKTVSVYFLTHNLGMNCNSDLCCMKGLSVIGGNGDTHVGQNNFWEGFVDGKNNTYYYLGYYDYAFTSGFDIQQLQQLNNGATGDAMKLINMTLFPVAYVEVGCGGSAADSGNQGVGEDNVTSPPRVDNPTDNPIDDFANTND